MELVGYARVSTREERQVFDRQIDALRAAGCQRIFDDRGSGASTDRPGLKACLDYLRKGDVLVVLDLDRLGRLAGELIRLVDELEGRGIGFRALNADFDTTTPMGRAFLQIQAAFAEMERNVIRQRVKEGIAAARARGRKGGRPRRMTPERLRYAQHLMADASRNPYRKFPHGCCQRAKLRHGRRGTRLVVRNPGELLIGHRVGSCPTKHALLCPSMP